jgi:hypothetical protein
MRLRYRSKYADLRGTVAEVFEYHQDDLWLEMELATKVTPAILNKYLGFHLKIIVLLCITMVIVIKPF